MQVFVAGVGHDRYQVPVTYRSEPLASAATAHIGEMEHSVLGRRVVCDTLSDGRFVTVLAGVAASAYGQALGFALRDDRWYSVPDELILGGCQPLPGRCAVDGFSPVGDLDGPEFVLRNDALELTVYRRLAPRPIPAVGLTARPASGGDTVVLAALQPLG